MPYTTQGNPCHLWHEEALRRGDRALCGWEPEEEPDLVRLKEVRTDLTGGKPRTIAEFVLWAEICRECAEHLADLTDRRTAPVQWLKGVGSKRAGKLKRNGVKTLKDMESYVEEDPDMAFSSPDAPLLKTEELAEDTGISNGTAGNLLNQLVAEAWRRETPNGGDEDLLEEARDKEVLWE